MSIRKRIRDENDVNTSNSITSLLLFDVRQVKNGDANARTISDAGDYDDDIRNDAESYLRESIFAKAKYNSSEIKRRNPATVTKLLLSDEFLSRTGVEMYWGLHEASKLSFKSYMTVLEEAFFFDSMMSLRRCSTSAGLLLSSPSPSYSSSSSSSSSASSFLHLHSLLLLK